MGLLTEFGRRLSGLLGADATPAHINQKSGLAVPPSAKSPAALTPPELNSRPSLLDGVPPSASRRGENPRPRSSRPAQERRLWLNDVPLGTEHLGFLSEQYESHNGGVGTIGRDGKDRGGGGYGPWQLSTRSGMGAFLKSKHAQPFLSYLGSAGPGTAEFDERYRSVANDHPAELRKAEHDYLYSENYNRLARHAAEKGFDLSNQGIREALWSLAVQHGGAASILDDVVAENRHKGDPSAVLGSIYQKRMDYVAKPGRVHPSELRSVLERYRKEGAHIIRHDALVRQERLHQNLVDTSNEERMDQFLRGWPNDPRREASAAQPRQSQ